MVNDHAEIRRLNAALKERLLLRLPGPDSLSTAIDGFTLYRRETVNIGGCEVGRPAVGLIVQGGKYSAMGGYEYRYGENQYCIGGIDVPVSFYAINPTPEKPFLSMTLCLDQSLLARMVGEIADLPVARAGRGNMVADADADLLGAFLRLLELLDKPEQIAMRAPLIIREIHYLMLVGPMGHVLRQLNTAGTQSHQVRQAIAWIRSNFKEPLRIASLARLVHMGTSTFHRHFKEITGLTPLQYHKRLRLHEAQRLMLTDSYDVANAAYEVGYESPTQFIREYKRLFGEPPHRDTSRRRGQLLQQACPRIPRAAFGGRPEKSAG